MCSGPQIVILKMPLCSEPSSYSWKLLTDVWSDQNFCLENFTSENRPKSAKKEGKNVGTFFELFFNFFFQTMICSQNVLQTQGFQTLTSDFQYRAYSWRFFDFWKFYLFFIILNLKCVEYSIVCRDVRSTDIQKPKLGPERYDNLEHFPYKTR